MSALKKSPMGAVSGGKKDDAPGGTLKSRVGMLEKDLERRQAERVGLLHGQTDGDGDGDDEAGARPAAGAGSKKHKNKRAADDPGEFVSPIFRE